LIKYKLEAADALHRYFTQGFAISDRALEQAPDVVIDRIAYKISAKLGVAPTFSKDRLIKERMEAMASIFRVLGEPDYEAKEILQRQMLAELISAPPAPTLQEMDRWYASDFYKMKKQAGDEWNVYYRTDLEFTKMLGRYASQESRKRGFPIYKQDQIILSGRIAPVHQYRREALEAAWKRMKAEGKVGIISHLQQEFEL